MHETSVDQAADKLMKNRSVKTIALTLGQALTTLIGLLTAVILVRLVTKDDYATYKQTFIAFNFFAPFLMLGLPNSMLYFVSKDQTQGRSLLLENLALCLTSLTVTSCFIAIGLAPFLAHHLNNPALVATLPLAIPFVFAQIVTRSATSALTAIDRVSTVAKLAVFTRIIQFVVVLLVIMWTQHITHAISATSTAMVVTAAITLFYAWSYSPRTLARVQLSSIWRSVCFGLPLAISSVVSTLHRNIDKLLVSWLGQPEDFAVYINGAMEIPLIGIVTASAASILTVDLAKMYEERRFEEAISLFRRASCKCALLILPAACYLFVMAEPVMVFLYTDAYRDSYLPFRIYLLMLPIRVVFYGPLLIAAGQPKLIMIRTIIALGLNITLSILLTHFLGPMVGPASATVLVVYFFAVPYCIVSICHLWQTNLSSLLPCRELATIFTISILSCISISIIVKIFTISAVFNLVFSFIIYAILIFSLFCRFHLVHIDQIVSLLGLKRSRV